MTKVKVIDSVKKSEFENEVNAFLEGIKGNEIIDIKYSHSVINSYLERAYSVLIIYK